MSESGEIQKSLEYVEDVLKLKRTQSVEKFPWLALMWALYCLVGFALADFVPNIAGKFFFFGSIAGCVISVVYSVILEGRRRDSGERMSKYEQMFGKIVGGTVMALMAVVGISVWGPLGGELLFQIIFILLGLELFLFGSYGEFRPPALAGIGLMLWAFVITWFDTLQFTVGGGLIAIGIFSMVIASCREQAEAVESK